MAKPKLALYWAASCGGCEIAIVDLHEKVLAIDANFEVVFWPVAMDAKYKDVKAMDPGSIDLCLFNGAIRNSENEEIAKLMRSRSKTLVAFGSCAHEGCIPGLANATTKKDIFQFVYHDAPSNESNGGVEPMTVSQLPEGEVDLPVFYETVKTLDQVIDVDYYIPGCPPQAHQIWAVIELILSGAELPPAGTVIGAGNETCCEECSRTREEKRIRRFVRPHLIIPEPDQCLLDQGILCMGPATRSGCGCLCPEAGMPCRGCYGPPPQVKDQGSKMISALASVIDSTDADEINSIIDQIEDPVGTLYRFSLPRLDPAEGAVMKTITIDPVTRLEGHGRIDIFMDDDGHVANAYFRIPELRGFEQFCVGRPVEELPRITTRICGVCPEAHHMASAKTCDAVYHVKPPPAGEKLRRLLYNIFYVADHAVHFYILSGPDFVVGPDAPVSERNVFGLIRKVGLETGKKVIETRAEAQEMVKLLGGKSVHQVTSLPGGVSRGLSEEERKRAVEICTDLVEFGKFTLQILDDVVLKNQAYLDLILGDTYKHETHYMGLVNEQNQPDYYDGKIRLVDTHGKEIAKFAPADYLDHVAEHVEPWSYLKFPYLKARKWMGLVDGDESGVYRAAPLARLNVAEGMSTPLAHEQYQRMMETLGGPPVHHTLAYHWARVIELVNAAELALDLANDPEITDDNIRTIPTDVPTEGVGVVEAPRGTLFHHYVTDEKGIVKKANLIVGTTNNYAAINLSVKKASQDLIEQSGELSEGVLNMIEMAFRAYDPCFGCATHALPGQMPLDVRLLDSSGEELDRLVRD